MNVIIVEDEVNVRAGFIKMIQVFCPSLNVVGIADSVESGLQLIQETEFDILFLDINLPDGSGFDLLYRLEERPFKTIFVTAYDQYALDAFKVSAADYLMKPVAPDDLKKAISNISKETVNEKILKENTLKERISEAYSQGEKILLKDVDKIHLVVVSDILYCMAEGSYTTFFLKNNLNLVTSSNLKEYERVLEPYGFHRCHHSYLINLEHIKALHKTDSTVIMSNEFAVPLSTRKKPMLLNTLKDRFLE